MYSGKGQGEEALESFIVAANALRYGNDAKRWLQHTTSCPLFKDRDQSLTVPPRPSPCLTMVLTYLTSATITPLVIPPDIYHRPTEQFSMPHELSPGITPSVATPRSSSPG